MIFRIYCKIILEIQFMVNIKGIVMGMDMSSLKIIIKDKT